MKSTFLTAFESEFKKLATEGANKILGIKPGHIAAGAVALGGAHMLRKAHRRYQIGREYERQQVQQQ